MKKRPLFYLFCMVASFGGLFVTSCNDDDYPGAAPDEITAHYSSKLSDGTRANLALTYSGHELIGKSVNFETNDSRTAQLTLQCILPHEAETRLTGISLTPDGQGGYTFSGDATGSQTETTFSYNGTVQKGKLALDIKNPQIPANPLVQAKDLDFVKAGVVLRIAIGDMDLGELIEGKVNEFLKAVLKDISFHTDGNITASYSGMQESDWKSSPVNLVSFYMTDGNTLYVAPNVDMIIRQIRLNQAVTRADDNLITVLPKVYALLNQWSTTGLKLSYAENSITLNKEELDPVFALLKVLPDAIRDISIGEIPGLGESTIGTLADLSSLISDLSLTLYFNVKNAG